MPTPTLYIDHSVVTHPTSWKPVEDVLAGGKAQLVLSVWNLFEIGSATDKAQQAERLKFLMQFAPRWVLERVQIQQHEVQGFLWQEKFGVPLEPVQAIRRYLSEVEAYLAGSKTRIGVTPEQWIGGVDFKNFEKHKDLAPTALRQLQAHGAKAIAKKQSEIFRAWIGPLLPKFKPDGHAFTKAELTELLDLCEKNLPAFFKACPAIAVEDSMTRARTSAPGRNPQRSDGIDLMHAVVALAYCDHFVVRDRFSYHCCEFARNELAHMKLAEIYRDAEVMKTALA